MPIRCNATTFAIVFISVLSCAVDAADPSPATVGGSLNLASTDWPHWRGPTHDGVADPNQRPPVRWSKDENVIWKAAVPGRGHGSPSVVGDRVYLATAEEDREIQAVLCYERTTGKLIWRTDVHTGGMDRKGNKKTTQASSTVVCDGTRLLVNFLNSGAIFTTALDFNGKQLWQAKVSDFATHQGFGSSPTIYGAWAFVTTDCKIGGRVAALDRSTGAIVWQEERPKEANYASAVVLRVADRDQLLVQGCDLVTSFEPGTGKKLWEVKGSTVECVTTMVTDGKRVFVSGGYPRNHVQAIEADGSGKTAWENGARVYVPSMVVHQGYLYATLDPGIATCWKSDTGEEMWKKRLGGSFRASLVLVGDTLYTTNEEGKTFVFKANPKEYEGVAENQLGEEAYATLAICGGRVYARVVENGEKGRQEMLYCLGER